MIFEKELHNSYLWSKVQDNEVLTLKLQTWASSTNYYLDACCPEERVVVRVGARHHPVGLPLYLEAWPLTVALLRAWILEEGQVGKQGVACLQTKRVVLTS